MSTKKSAESAADMEPVLMHAVIQSKAKTAEATGETRAAKSLGVQLLAVVRAQGVTRTWRVQLAEGGQAALVTLGDTATPSDRELFARGAQARHAAGPIEGVLPVRKVAPARDAFLTELLATGSAKDLAALSWPVRRQLEFVARVLRSLESVHGLGLVHGCLCESNVLLDDDLNPVLSEVGLVDVSALAARGAGEEYAAFAAPEVKRGDEPDVRADVYSVGRLLQELTKAASPPRSVTEIVAKSTSADAAMRHASAKELASDVQRVIDELARQEATAAPLARPPTPGPIEPRAPAKRERPSRVDPHETAFAPRKPGAPSAPWKPPVALGIAGIAMVAGSFAAAAFLGGSNDLLRPLLVAGGPLGVALATTLLPALPGRPVLGRAVLALGAAALFAVLDPLALAYRLAAQARMRGDDTTRRAAIAEVMRLGRDFRGLSFSGAALQGVDLTAADLRRVSFSGADLTGAHLYVAEIDGASFANAQLAGADLSGTQLQLADVSGARCDEGTKLPSSWRCEGGHVMRAGPPAP